MPRHLISFDDGSMDHISEAELPAVGKSARTVVRDAICVRCCADLQFDVAAES